MGRWADTSEIFCFTDWDRAKIQSRTVTQRVIANFIWQLMRRAGQLVRLYIINSVDLTPNKTLLLSGKLLVRGVTIGLGVQGVKTHEPSCCLVTPPLLVSDDVQLQKCYNMAMLSYDGVREQYRTLKICQVFKIVSCVKDLSSVQNSSVLERSVKCLEQYRVLILKIQQVIKTQPCVNLKDLPSYQSCLFFN